MEVLGEEGGTDVGRQRNKGKDDEGIRGRFTRPGARANMDSWIEMGGWELRISDQILIKEHQPIKE